MTLEFCSPRGRLQTHGLAPSGASTPSARLYLPHKYGSFTLNWINSGIADFETALKKEKKEYVLHMYPNAQHAFHNDTAAERYNKEAAELAWNRTTEFLQNKLSAR